MSADLEALLSNDDVDGVVQVVRHLCLNSTLAERTRAAIREHKQMFQVRQGRLHIPMATGRRRHLCSSGGATAVEALLM